MLTSFDQGFEILIEELAAALDRSGQCTIRKRAGTAAVAPLQQGEAAGGWRVQLQDGTRLEADAIVLALPSRGAGALTQGFDPELASEFASIPDAPLIVIGLGYRSADFPDPLHGFGFLVPQGQGPRSLGVLWDSCIYPNRAPGGRVLLRAMLGGAQDPEAIQLSDDQVLAQVRADLSRTMNLRARPDPVWIFRHPHGIPQYVLGHPGRLARIDGRLAAWPGLTITGNSYRGISVNHCVEHSIPVARRVLRALMPSP